MHQPHKLMTACTLHGLLCLLTLNCVVAAAGSAPASAAAARPSARMLATQVEEAAVLDHRRALVLDDSGQFRVVDLDSGATAPWRCSWQPEAYGWNHTHVHGLLASPQGTTVSYLLSPWSDAAESGVASLRVVCDSAGQHGRPIATRHVGDDWSRHEEFSMDGRYLIDMEMHDQQLPLDFTPAWWADNRAVLQKAFDAGWDDESGSPYADAYDMVAGRLVRLPGYDNAPDGEPEPSPWGDYRVGIDGREQTVCFRLAGDRWVIAGRLPYEHFPNYDSGAWVAPHLKLVGEHEGEPRRRVILRVDGESWPAPQDDWVVYTYLPDRRSFYSRDGGQTVEFGSINWRTGEVQGRMKCPQLGSLAQGSWRPLPDSSGALVQSGTELWLVEI